MDYPRDRAEQYYSKTLALFLAGVSIAFVGVFVDLTISFMAG